MVLNRLAVHLPKSLCANWMLQPGGLALHVVGEDDEAALKAFPPFCWPSQAAEGDDGPPEQAKPWVTVHPTASPSRR